MKALRIPLRAILYREDGVWIAHCLELDLIGDGATQEEALELLSQAILTQVEASIHYQSLHSLFRPAEAKYFEMFAAGRDVAIGTLKVPAVTTIASVTIEELEAREYIDSVDSGAELCPS
jgi:predicted RNase H-like HicB family nuclease